MELLNFRRFDWSLAPLIPCADWLLKSTTHHSLAPHDDQNFATGVRDPWTMIRSFFEIFLNQFGTKVNRVYLVLPIEKLRNQNKMKKSKNKLS